MIDRRNFLKIAGLGLLGLIASDIEVSLNKNESQIQEDLEKGYKQSGLNHNPIKWEHASEGLEFSKTDIYLGNKKIDTLATLKINPEMNKIRVFNGNNNTKIETNYIKDWQKKTGALAMINSNQYMANPEYYPCALVICDGEQKGPKYNEYSRGMFVSEPDDLENKLKKADILDFDYDKFDYNSTPYTQGVQHWPILLDRNGRIKVKESNLQASRTLIAKTNQNEILFMNTEGGYFTLYNLGKFFKESNERKDKGFNINTVMNLDGGIATGMTIQTPSINYLNKGKEKIPGVIGVFPRY